MDRIVDQHMHTHFSHDSKEKFEAYLELTEGPIVSTEHLDFNSVLRDYKDLVPDYDAYCEEVDRLNKEYGNRIRKGLEIGYREDNVDKVLEYLDGKEYDLIILSVHENGKLDYMRKLDKNVNLWDLIEDYYENLLKAVKSPINFNVLGHIDFCLRGKEYDLNNIKRLEDRFIEILSELIKREAALEVNTRSLYQYGNLDFYSYILDLYLDLGGQLISLGSDCHYTNNFKLNFDDAIEFLKSKGINKLAMYKNQELYYEQI